MALLGAGYQEHIICFMVCADITILRISFLFRGALYSVEVSEYPMLLHVIHESEILRSCILQWFLDSHAHYFKAHNFVYRRHFLIDGNII